MPLQLMGLQDINGSLVVFDQVKNAGFDELVSIKLQNGSSRTGRIVEIEGERAVVQVFEGTNGLGLDNVNAQFTGKPMEIPLSKELLGRIFDGAGRPIDGLGDIYPECFGDINGLPINPVSRTYPRNCISTGISSIDALITLIRGQKLPIFSDSGLPHNKLAAQIVRQAKVANEQNQAFGIVFAAMGVTNDVADFFKAQFEKSGALERVVMFQNLANDPIIERILTPRCALTAAEYLAYQCNMHILVILTDMTAYAEAVREFSSSKGEIPSRKGYPGYLYSDFASIYERAGMVNSSSGSVTQIPILTMPNGDITHPIPDLTGYITEGQIVLDRQLSQEGVYPPIAILPSLSRLMKDGIGKGYTREDHQDVANQLFSCYAKVADARSLASVIGEEELSDTDKAYLTFGRQFEAHFLNQGEEEDRTILQTLDLGWDLLALLPKGELDRIDTERLNRYYHPSRADRFRTDEK